MVAQITDTESALLQRAEEAEAACSALGRRLEAAEAAATSPLVGWCPGCSILARPVLTAEAVSCPRCDGPLEPEEYIGELEDRVQELERLLARAGEDERRLLATANSRLRGLLSELLAVAELDVGGGVGQDLLNRVMVEL